MRGPGMVAAKLLHCQRGHIVGDVSTGRRHIAVLFVAQGAARGGTVGDGRGKEVWWRGLAGAVSWHFMQQL